MTQTKEYRKTKDLKLWDKNPRSIKKEDFERLKKQIQELGQYKPLIITPDNEVIGGNMRLRAYMDLEIDDVWVSVVNPKDEEEKLKYALSDNDRAGYYDDDLLANLSSEYPDFKWENYAVDLDPPETLGNILKNEVVEDEVPEVSNGQSVSKLGEVYQLGRHKLMCGDSTNIEDVEKLMNGQKADMVFTDPPYGLGYEYNSYKDIQGNEYLSFCDKWFDTIKGVPLIVITTGWKYMSYWWLKEPRDMMYWLARNKQTGGTVFHFRRVEPIFVWGKVKNKYNEDIIESLTDRLYGLRDEHSCPKPIKLCSEIIKAVNRKDNVLDLFGGSGSTLIACEQLNRTCYMMELDNRYTDVIIKRWQTFTGQEAIRVSDGKKWNELNQEIPMGVRTENTTKDTTEKTKKE